MSKTKKIIIWVLIILNVLTWGDFLFIKYSYFTYKPRDCYEFYEIESTYDIVGSDGGHGTVTTYKIPKFELPDVELTLDKKKAKKVIKKLCKTPHFYKVKNLEYPTLSRAITMFRIVEVDPDLEIYDYIIGYTHELMHIKYQTNNDTYVCYRTFKTLYESGNEELRYYAIKYANDVVSGGWSGTDYDCSYYIYKYFK